MIRNTHKKKGFTLLELSIVLVIVGIMLYAGIAIGSIQVEAAKMKNTRDKLNKIDRALQLYLEMNNSLPCPASGSTALDAANFGEGDKNLNGDGDGVTEVSDATCPNVSATMSTNTYLGVVPTRDLDLSDEFMMDGWGNRITYVVSKHCIDPENWSTADLSSKHKCTTGADDPVNATDADGAGDLHYEPGGNITIEDNTAQDGTDRTTRAVYLLLSHGRNGLGAWSDEGARMETSADSSVYDLDNASRANADGTGGDEWNTKFRDSWMADWEGATDDAVYFDDIVSWKTGPQLWFEKDN